jgi:hypothetical protein
MAEPTLDTISSSQSSKEVTANAFFEALRAALLYSRRATTTVGLTWGYYGGRYNSTLIDNDTVSLTGSATNYIVAAKSTGVVSVSTATTNWNNSTDYERLYKVVTGASSVTGDPEDHRNFYGGGSGAVAAEDVSITDAGTYYTGTDVEAALQEIGAELAAMTGLADGDYGDITVSGTGTAMAIDNDAVTYAKMQNVSAASKLLGRGDSGSGDVQEITVGSGLTMTGTTLSASGGGGTPGGSTTQVQFNDAGAFGGDAGLTYDKTTDTLQLGVTNGTGTFTTQAGTTTNLSGALNISTGGAVSAATGAISIKPGTVSNSGTGGAASLEGGQGPNGGNVTVKGGTATSSTGTSGNVTIQGGPTAANGLEGGSISIDAGDGGATAGNGGDVSITAGDGRGILAATGDPGNITLTAGTAISNTSGWDSHDGGFVTLAGGAGGAAGGGAHSGDGGDITLQGGNAGAGTGNADGGDVLLKGGTGTGTGNRGNVGVANGAALGTTTTGGFFCIPTCAGTPTGTPTNVPTGSVAMIYDTTNNKIYIYNGAWKATAALT